MSIVIIKNDGQPTGSMPQVRAEAYLFKVMHEDKSRQASLKQALNDVTIGRGKPTGSYLFDGFRVLHSSAGKMGTKSTVSIFFYDDKGQHYIVAMGTHITSNSYKLSDYGQVTGLFKDGPFKQGNTIRL